MPVPDVAAVTAYLTSGDPQTDWAAAEQQATIMAALAAEKDEQAGRCRVPADTADWPAGLAEALCRRVARNLAARGLPLGFIPGLDTSEGTGAYLGSTDPEVRRKEARYRKLVLG